MDWKKFFDSLGMNGTRWQWRVMRWQDRWKDFLNGFSAKKKQVNYQHKFCDECHALIDRSDKVCPHCDAKVRGYKAQVASRTVNTFTPSSMLTITHWLLVPNLIVAVLTLVPTEQGSTWNLLAAWMMEHGVFEASACVQQGHWWRLISYGFLHGGLLHILFNMIALIQLGPLVENAIGRRRFFVLYMVSLMVAMVPKILLATPIPTVGASGALFGLVGFGVSYSHVQGMHSWRGVFLNWAAMGMVFGFVIPNVDNWAHGGGLICGLAIGWLLGKEGLARAEAWRRKLDPVWLVLAWALFAVTLWSFYVWGYETWASLRVLNLMG